MIKLQRQLYQHDPANGTFGDCHRTAMAMVLGMDRDDIPNFGEHYGDMAAWDKAIREFLAPLGLAEFQIPLLMSDEDNSSEGVISYIRRYNKGTPFILSGKSPGGFNHSVVVDADDCILDPQGRLVALVGPTDEGGVWWVTVYAKLPEVAPKFTQRDLQLAIRLSDAMSQDDADGGHDIQGGMLGRTTSKLIHEIVFLLEEYVPPTYLKNLLGK